MSDKIEIKKDTFYKGSIVVLAVLLIISIFTGGFGIGVGSSSSGGNTNVLIVVLLLVFQNGHSNIILDNIPIYLELLEKSKRWLQMEK